ncbi:MAG TPA: cysteine dioxygenase family protein [Roseiflexaceae bacterium]|nr:cysteine dioxygenase family protein [Roseiflexaceae bacterium]
MPEDEYILDTPAVRAFVEQVRAALAAAPPREGLEALRPAFAALLADQQWLPEAYQLPVAESGMGGGIATWLIYRSGDGGLSLFSLVVPPGAATPVHDHLAWGLVGLYAGEQDERVYQPQGEDASGAPLKLVEQNHLHPGDFYLLMPPEGDMHSVATISGKPSVSIHLLGNDTGCVWRHAYTPEDGGVRAFRSGWSNVPCRD